MDGQWPLLYKDARSRAQTTAGRRSQPVTRNRLMGVARPPLECARDVMTIRRAASSDLALVCDLMDLYRVGLQNIKPSERRHLLLRLVRLSVLLPAARTIDGGAAVTSERE